MCSEFEFWKLFNEKHARNSNSGGVMCSEFEFWKLFHEKHARNSNSGGVMCSEFEFWMGFNKKHARNSNSGGVTCSKLEFWKHFIEKSEDASSEKRVWGAIWGGVGTPEKTGFCQGFKNSSKQVVSQGELATSRPPAYNGTFGGSQGVPPRRC